MTSQNLQDCQQAADEVTILMKNNVDKIFEREGKLENLNVRAEELKDMAGNFQKTAKAVERKTRCEKWRWYIIAAVILALVIVIIIAVILAMSLGDAAPSSSSSSAAAITEDGN